MRQPHKRPRRRGRVPSTSEAVVEVAAPEGEAERTAQLRLTPGTRSDATRFALHERTKELRCLYRVSRVLFSSEDLHAGLSQVVAAIPSGWQFPEHTHARLRLQEGTYESPDFRAGTVCLREPISAAHARVGELEVHLAWPDADSDVAPFLPEESELLRAIAERVGETVARRETERRLQRREAHFRTLVESAADLIILLDAQAAVQYVSPSATELTGIQAEDLVGKSCFDFVHVEDLAALQVLWSHATAQGGTARAEVRLPHRSGGWCPVEVVGRNLIHDPDVGGVLVVGRDMTARRALEDQLLQAQKMEAIGRLAGGIAHDFNNLLSVIDVQSEFLCRSFDSQDARRVDVKEIQRASRHGAALTRQLLAFARREVPRPRGIDLRRLVRDTERLVRRVVGEDIVLDTDLGPDTGVIHADPRQLEQVLLNLVVNARDAMPTGGRLVIRTGSVAHLEGQGGDQRKGPWACVEVSDTGEGIDPAVCARIFEPFYTTKSEGTGLGLSTVYGIVTQTGGHVRVDSEPGRGTTFRMYLPQVGEAAEDSGSLRPAPPSPGGGETVMVVDDDDGLRRATRRVLRSLGYQVLVAPSGEEALAQACSYPQRIDLLLSDVVMPGMGGMEVARRLLHDRPETRVLLFSGYDGGSPMGGSAIDPGVPLLAKPFTHAELGEAVRAVLDGGEAAGPT
jgi:two-component system, cell cycle sensor histidine kinase and response regulator CckA